MENTIRILEIFAGSNQLATMFCALLVVVLLAFVVRRHFLLRNREQDLAEGDLAKRLADVEFKVSRQIEHKLKTVE